MFNLIKQNIGKGKENKHVQLTASIFYVFISDDNVIDTC